MVPEPEPNNPDNYNIVFKYNDVSYNRMFLGSNRIIDLKLYLKVMIRTFSNVELSENFPRKIYSNDSDTIKAAGLSKNQILWVKLYN